MIDTILAWGGLAKLIIHSRKCSYNCEYVLLGVAILGSVAARKYSSVHDAMKALNAAGQNGPGVGDPSIDEPHVDLGDDIELSRGTQCPKDHGEASRPGGPTVSQIRLRRGRHPTNARPGRSHSWESYPNPNDDNATSHPSERTILIYVMQDDQTQTQGTQNGDPISPLVASHLWIIIGRPHIVGKISKAMEPNAWTLHHEQKSDVLAVEERDPRKLKLGKHAFSFIEGDAAQVRISSNTTVEEYYVAEIKVILALESRIEKNDKEPDLSVNLAVVTESDPNMDSSWDYEANLAQIFNRNFKHLGTFRGHFHNNHHSHSFSNSFSFHDNRGSHHKQYGNMSRGEFPFDIGRGTFNYPRASKLPRTPNRV
uniref:Uncharacterized protein n=1 Tax=Cannabis sativa TaxID=3483 RepID=A0A803P981_CANSA